jgi:carboxypeptidase Taq
LSDPLEQLKQRLAEVMDLSSVSRLLSWDQQTMMPPAGAGARAEHAATLRRIAHELFTSDDTARLLEAVRPLEESLEPDSDDVCLIRVARRDFEKEVRVPTELRAEMARAAAHARGAWVEARSKSDFATFLPALERNVALRLEYVACFDGVDEPYDVLLDDFEPDTKTADVRATFAGVKDALVPLIAELRDGDGDDAFLQGEFAPERQEALARELVATLGMRPGTWRLDPTEHPFASGAAVDDIRITTRYDPASVDSLFATIHEYGHGLCGHQLPRELERLPIGASCSLGIHESQSRLWENLVGRARPFWRFFYPRLQQTFPENLGGVDIERFYRAINRVQPSLIRIHADEVTYGMHVILRFELEQDIVNQRVELRDLPQVWNERMYDYLGVEVPDDAHGVLQDVHWAAGYIGYFATYLLGTVMSVQIWRKLLEDVPDLEQQIERGDFGGLRDWLGIHVHALGRRWPPQETLRRAIGETIDARPYLDYLDTKFRRDLAAA